MAISKLAFLFIASVDAITEISPHVAGKGARVGSVEFTGDKVSKRLALKLELVKFRDGNYLSDENPNGFESARDALSGNIEARFADGTIKPDEHDQFLFSLHAVEKQLKSAFALRARLFDLEADMRSPDCADDLEQNLFSLFLTMPAVIATALKHDKITLTQHNHLIQYIADQLSGMEDTVLITDGKLNEYAEEMKKHLIEPSAAADKAALKASSRKQSCTIM